MYVFIHCPHFLFLVILFSAWNVISKGMFSLKRSDFPQVYLGKLSFSSLHLISRRHEKNVAPTCTPMAEYQVRRAIDHGCFGDWRECERAGQSTKCRVTNRDAIAMEHMTSLCVKLNHPPHRAPICMQSKAGLHVPSLRLSSARQRALSRTSICPCFRAGLIGSPHPSRSQAKMTSPLMHSPVNQRSSCLTRCCPASGTMLETPMLTST